MVFEGDFAIADQDRNGSLDREECRALLRQQLQTEPEEAEFEHFVRALDLDGDGRVSLYEYISFVVSPDWLEAVRPEDRTAVDQRLQESLQRFTLEKQGDEPDGHVD